MAKVYFVSDIKTHYVLAGQRPFCSIIMRTSLSTYFELMYSQMEESFIVVDAKAGGGLEGRGIYLCNN